MKYSIITNSQLIHKEIWSDFIFKNPSGNFFQFPKIYEFYKSISGYKPITLFCLNQNNQISGVLLAIIQTEGGYFKSKLSSRCIIYGGPVINNNLEVADLLLKKLIQITQNKSIYIEFRNLFDTSEQTNVFRQNGLNYREHYNFILKIENAEENLKKMNESRRRQIRKSLKAGACIYEAKSMKDVKEYYLILKNLYTEKIKKPLPDFSFFQNFFLTPDLGKYLLIKYKKKIVGGIMCCLFRETIYEWYICGLDKDFKGIYPSVLATWAGIKYASENGFKYFDFLGAGSKDDYGVREFKSKFGGELVSYGRYIRINKPFLYNLGRFGLKIIYR